MEVNFLPTDQKKGMNVSNRTFGGGVHPHDYKELTRKKEIRVMPVPVRVVIPLQQHIGAPAKVLVKKNDEVKTGQVIAEAGGFVSLPVHASITGKVTAVTKMPHPVLGKALSVIIEGDGTDDWVELPGGNPEEMSPEEMKNRIRDAGIAGMGGASFPTHVKLSPPKEKDIDILILNGAECEPFLTCDHRLMLEEGEGIVRGMRYLMKILDVKKAYIGIEDNKPDAVAEMKRLTAGLSGVEVVSLPVKYPQGAEKQLIYAVTGRTVPSGKLPMEVGCVVQNVGTALAVSEAVEKGKPMIERVLTITGDGIKEPLNVKARIGALYQDVAEFAGGLTGIPKKIISGGPMMGMAQPNLALPVIKGTSGILILQNMLTEIFEEDPCINCGRCVEVCPMNLLPTTIAQYVEYGKYEMAEEFNAMDCIECGSCSYICPSRRYLVQYIRRGKAEIIKRKRKAS